MENSNAVPGWYQRIKNFPIIGEFLTALGGAAVAHLIIDKDGRKILNPAMIRQAAPHFAKSQADEAAFAQILMQLDTGERKAIREVWMPTMGKHQRADFILSVAEMTVGQTDEEKRANLATTIAHLRDFARIPNNTRRTKAADGQNFLQHLKEGDYLIVKIEKAIGKTFESLPDFQTWLFATINTVWTSVKQTAKATARATKNGAQNAASATGKGIAAGAKATANAAKKVNDEIGKTADVIDKQRRKLDRAAGRIINQRRKRGFLKRLFGI